MVLHHVLWTGCVNTSLILKDFVTSKKEAKRLDVTSVTNQIATDLIAIANSLEGFRHLNIHKDDRYENMKRLASFWLAS